MNLATASVSKGDFAAMLGVSAGRVSQYIAEGKIFGAALEGEGRRAKINPEIARRQLGKTLDPDQRFGANGIALSSIGAVPVKPAGNLFSQLPQPATPAAAPPHDPHVDELAQLRLRRERLKTEQAEREALLEVGKYMLAEDGRRETTKAVSAAFSVMEQALQPMAEALAEQFGLPRRDLHHALAKAFRSVRAKHAEEFQRQADAEPEHLEREDE